MPDTHTHTFVCIYIYIYIDGTVIGPVVATYRHKSGPVVAMNWKVFW